MAGDSRRDVKLEKLPERDLKALLDFLTLSSRPEVDGDEALTRLMDSISLKRALAAQRAT